jgi:acetyltransferase-like isoleucine patch superfamily enzyme
MSGHVTINDGVFIGNNATLRDRITIGENAIVGAGAVVLRHVKSNEVYKAMEARLLSIDAREVKI